MLQFESFLNCISKPIFKDGKMALLINSEIDEVMEAVPLVFGPERGPDDHDGVHVDEHDQSIPLDLPFRTCFLEVTDGVLIELPDWPASVTGIYVHELSPRHYHILALVYKKGSYSVHFYSENEIQKHFINLISHLLKRLYSESVGHCNPRTAIKIKAHGEKKKSRINKVIYIGSKKQRSLLESKATREINWEYRWRVRGHWRNIPGRFGRDRDGKVQKDFTWVTEHTKGPEAAPIIEKVRVIKSPIDKVVAG